MARTQHKLIGALVAALLVVPLAIGGGAAQVSDQSANVGDFEEIVVEVDYSGTTDSTVTINDSSGTTVQTDTISGSSDVQTRTYNLDQGDYTVSVSSSNETAVNSYSVSTQSTLSAVSSDTVELTDTSDTITADVEFTAATSALVEVSNESGTVVDSQRIDVSSVDTSTWESADFTDLDATGNYTVDVSAEDTTAINQTEVTVESDSGLLGGGGIVAGAGSTELIAFALVVGGLAYAYREDWL